MYIVTFYSFKGGVGRSMALVNAGLELSKQNRRVLLVDFDLEAPGLDTFKALESREPSLGIVDFVNDFLSNGSTSNVDQYLSKCRTDPENGELWLMPAGGSTPDYAGQFQRIDWGDLYANQNGFLLMEELKQQWMDSIRPDYVLIDSRTGHTDVGGICTRQLPDAVAIFFFPNEQNLRGLSKTVREVRAEQEGPRNKDIQLHFIMSNVPDLDDEHQILESKIEEFTSTLGLEQHELMVVHRYDSLSLLNQEVFTRDRPTSRLASEYQEIVQQIVNANLGDRDGALRYLRSLEQQARQEPWAELTATAEIRLKVKEIEKMHATDAEVLYQLGLLYDREQELESAVSLYGRSTELNFRNPEVYIDRARALADLGNAEEANRDALRALDSYELPVRSIRRALNLVKDDELDKAAKSNAVASLGTEPRIRLAIQVYFQNEATRSVGRELIQSKVNLETYPFSDSWLRKALGLAYISMGNFTAARNLFTEAQKIDDDIVAAFNLAVACWGETGQPTRDKFQKVVEMHESGVDPKNHCDANYLQCISLAYWATREPTRGLQYAKKARSQVNDLERTLSCWRYLYVNKEEFLQDMDEIEELIEGNTSVSPAFVKP